MTKKGNGDAAGPGGTHDQDARGFDAAAAAAAEAARKAKLEEFFALSPEDRALQRERFARELGMRVSDLDALAREHDKPRFTDEERLRRILEYCRLDPVQRSLQRSKLAKELGVRGADLDAHASAYDAQREQEQAAQQAKQLAATIQAHQQSGGVVLNRHHPIETAQILVDKDYTNAEGDRVLHHYRETFYRWNGACYQQASNDDIDAVIWLFLRDALCVDKDRNLVEFKPDITAVANVASALKAVCGLDDRIEPHVWLDGGAGRPNPRDLLAVGNGLLDLMTGQLTAPTAKFFNLNATDVCFDPAAECPGFEKFLRDVLVHGDSIELAQEWLGLCLSVDTSFQKMLLAIGAKRSGKGTFMRIQRALLSDTSVSGPTMSSLPQQFGLEPLIGKTVAIVSDARIGKATDKTALVERLLSISGEDSLTVPRKFKSAWEGKLLARISIVSNDVPALHDTSGALASRFMVLRFLNSFFGREDRKLTEKLKKELSGILNFALEGCRRLRERGHFIQPEKSKELVEQVERLGSTTIGFVRSRCKLFEDVKNKIEPEKQEAEAEKYRVTKKELFGAWTSWLHNQGGEMKRGSKEWFSRELFSAYPSVGETRPQGEGKRPRVFTGIRLKTKEENDDDDDDDGGEWDD